MEEAAGLDLALLGLGSCHRSTTPSGPALVVGYATPPEHAYGAALSALAELLSRLR